ncbi:hypothetical protein HS088_TW21G00994 [Tripterygium wilfordii]|uniref:DUF7722 domain-containing protein n=1 Tax=Tripterygium wilfordii TaxID=458696 RepID=A0A7J7C3X0_TRIWF|nr:uncharacterized protein LOC119989751 [Tripterygium wilfordii]KAF5728840.1 hypothetical protein HS088_TW21G00994 [Tripterygium wilfordii]
MALLLRWLVHSACHVLGYRPEEGNNKHDHVVGLQAVTNKVFMEEKETSSGSGFQMPLHYPRYTKVDYEEMEEWKLDLLLSQYGLCFNGTLEEKRAFAMGAFLWA